MVGREDNANRRRDDVVRCVGVGQVLAVGDLQRQLKVLFDSTSFRRVDQRRGEVGARHNGAVARRQESDIAGTATEIEPFLANAGDKGVDERDVHLADQLGDVLERR